MEKIVRHEFYSSMLGLSSLTTPCARSISLSYLAIYWTLFQVRSHKMSPKWNNNSRSIQFHFILNVIEMCQKFWIYFRICYLTIQVILFILFWLLIGTIIIAAAVYELIHNGLQFNYTYCFVTSMFSSWDGLHTNVPKKLQLKLM